MHFLLCCVSIVKHKWVKTSIVSIVTLKMFDNQYNVGFQCFSFFNMRLVCTDRQTSALVVNSLLPKSQEQAFAALTGDRHQTYSVKPLQPFR